jgi:DNA (cytosine-5)-methyltransferase 1
VLKVLDLFSGIGGFSLGLERTGGFETVAFCEIDPFCRRVLAKHWPHVRQFEDVTKLKGEDVGPIDVICGGFPCQDLSICGGAAREGLAGERSGLWREYARLIGELRPAIVIVENVPGLLSLGLGDVLGNLAALGYAAEWECIPAGAVGAPHIRDRFWLVGYPNNEGQSDVALNDETPRLSGMASNANGSRLEVVFNRKQGQRSPFVRAHEWAAEPDVDRVAYGIPGRMDRLKALGNAVVPQIPELIGRAILEARAAA